VTPDSWLTDWELVDLATSAKKAAKRGGKNRVAITVAPSELDTLDVHVLGSRDAA
jgi:hypothetical protein